MGFFYNQINNTREWLQDNWKAIVAVFLVLGIGYYAYTRINADTQDNDATIYTVLRKDLQETLLLSGSIDAEEKVTLQFPTTGKVTWINADEGDYVEKYQALAGLDQRELQKRLERQLNSYLKVRANFDQSLDDNPFSEASNDEISKRMQRLVKIAQADLDNSVIDVELQVLAEEFSYIITPISGIITKANSAYAGGSITASQVSFEVVNPDTFYFSAIADQAEVVDLFEGMNGDLTLDSFIDSEKSGSIESISLSPVVGELGTNYEVKIKFLDTTDFPRYRLGMTGDVVFTLREIPNRLVIPSGYLQVDSNGRTFVYALDSNDDVIEKEVEFGEDIDGDLEITSGLIEGDRIVESLN